MSSCSEMNAGKRSIVCVEYFLSPRVVYLDLGSGRTPTQACYLSNDLNVVHAGTCPKSTPDADDVMDWTPSEVTRPEERRFGFVRRTDAGLWKNTELNKHYYPSTATRIFPLNPLFLKEFEIMSVIAHKYEATDLDGRVVKFERINRKSVFADGTFIVNGVRNCMFRMFPKDSFSNSFAFYCIPAALIQNGDFGGNWQKVIITIEEVDDRHEGNIIALLLMHDVEKNPGPVISVSHTIEEQSVRNLLAEIEASPMAREFGHDVHRLTEAVEQILAQTRRSMQTTRDVASCIVKKTARFLLAILGGSVAYMMARKLCANDESLWPVISAVFTADAAMLVSQFLLQDGEEEQETLARFIMKTVFNINDMRFIRRHANDFRSVTFAKGLMKSSVDTLIYIMDRFYELTKVVYKCWTGIPWDMSVDDTFVVDCAKKTISQMTELGELPEGNLMQPVTFRLMMDVADKARRLRYPLGEILGNGSLNITFCKTLEWFENIVGAVRAVRSQEALRRQPTFVLLIGGTSVGKSTLVPLLSSKICIDAGIQNISPSTTLYQHNNNRNDFYDGYRNQPVFWFDEFCSTTDSTEVFNHVSKIFELVNVAPKPCNMAAIEDKGNTFFTSDFVIATTNRDTWCNRTGAMRTDGEAFYRRISFAYRIKLRDGAKDLPEVDFSAWTFVKVRINEGECIDGAELSFDQVVKEIVASYKVNTEIHAKLNSANETIWRTAGRDEAIRLDEEARTHVQTDEIMSQMQLNEVLRRRERGYVRSQAPARDRMAETLSGLKNMASRFVLQDADEEDEAGADSFHTADEETGRGFFHVDVRRRIAENLRKGISCVDEMYRQSPHTEIVRGIGKIVLATAGFWAVFKIMRHLFGGRSAEKSEEGNLYEMHRQLEAQSHSHQSQRPLLVQSVTNQSQRMLNIPKEMKAQSSPDQTKVFLSTFVRTNMARVVGSTKFDSIIDGNAFFLTDRMIVTNAHFVNKIKNMTVSVNNGRVISFDIDNVIVAIHENRDIALITLPKQIQGVRDVRRHMIARDVACQGYDSTYVIKYNGDYSCEHVGVSRLQKSIQTSRGVFRNAYVVAGSRNYGDCGLPYFVATKGSIYLLGFHFAYEATTGSFATAVFSEDAKIELMAQSRGMIPDFQHFESEVIPDDQAIYVKRETRLRPTEFAGNLEKMPIGGDTDREPAPLRSVDGLDPFVVATRKIDVADHEVSDEIMAIARRVTREMAMKHRMPSNFPKTVTTDEAVFGCGSSENLVLRKYGKKIDMTTSAGYDYRNWPGSGKKKLFNVAGGLKDEFVDKCDQLREQLCRGEVPSDVYAVDCLKDELRSESKRQKCETRIISVLPAHFTVVVRERLLPYTAWMMSHAVEWQFAIGINPHSTDWTRLADRLRTHKRFIAGDFSGFDRTIPKALGSLFADYLKQVTRDDGSDKFIDAMVEYIQTAPRIAGNVKYYPTHGNPSGQPLTAYFNSFVNALVMEIAFIYQGRKEEIPWTHEDFENQCQLTVFGDDQVISVNEGSPWNNFSYASVATLAGEIGMKYTDAKKNIDLPDCIDFDDVTYLKRSFRKEGAYYFAPLEKSVITDMLSWYRISDSITKEEAITARAFNTIVEAFHYGERKFIEQKEFVNDLMCDVGYQVDNVTYQRILNAFFNGTITNDEADKIEIEEEPPRISGRLGVLKEVMWDAEDEKCADFVIDLRPREFQLQNGTPMVRGNTRMTGDVGCGNYFERMTMPNEVKDRRDNLQSNYISSRDETEANLGSLMENENIEQQINDNNGSVKIGNPPVSTVQDVQTTVDKTQIAETGIVTNEKNAVETRLSGPANSVWGFTNIKEQLERRYVAAEIPWSTDDAISKVIATMNFPQILFGKKRIQELLSKFYYFRASVEVEIRINSNQFQYGSLIASYLTTAPDYTVSDGRIDGDYRRQRMDDVYFATTNPNVVVSAQNNVTATLKIPWCAPFDWIPLDQVFNSPNSKVQNVTIYGEYLNQIIGKLNIMVLCPLSTPIENGSQACYVQVLARFVDIEVDGLQPLPWISAKGPVPGKSNLILPNLQLQSRKIDVQPVMTMMKPNVPPFSTQGLMDIAHGAVDAVGGVVGGVLDPILNVANSLVPVVGTAIDLFGWIGFSKPSKVCIQEPRTLTVQNDFATIVGNDVSHSLGLMEDPSVTNGQQYFDPDSTLFNELAKQETFLGYSTVTSDLQAGTMIAEVPVRPMPSWEENGDNKAMPAGTVVNGLKCKKDFTVYSMQQWGGYANYYSNAFNYWKGTTRMRVHFYASGYHQARFLLFWTPNRTTVEDMTNLMSDAYGDIVSKQVVIENGEADVEFEIPYCRSSPYLPTLRNDPSTVVTQSDGSYANLYRGFAYYNKPWKALSQVPTNSANGFFYVMVMNQSVPMQTSSKAPIYAYVYQSFPDIVFEQYVGFSNYAPWLDSDPIPHAVLQGQLDGDQGSVSKNVLFDHFADQPTDVLSLLHRYETMIYDVSESQPLPLPWERTKAGFNVGKAPYNISPIRSIMAWIYPFYEISNFKMMISPFRFARGSSRMRIVKSVFDDPLKTKPVITLVTEGMEGPTVGRCYDSAGQTNSGSSWGDLSYYPSMEVTIPWYNSEHYQYIHNLSLTNLVHLSNPDTVPYVADRTRVSLTYGNPEGKKFSTGAVALAFAAGDDFRLGGRIPPPKTFYLYTNIRAEFEPVLNSIVASSPVPVNVGNTVDVNVGNEVGIRAKAPLDVNVGNEVDIKTKAPLNVNVGNKVDVSVNNAPTNSVPVSIGDPIGVFPSFGKMPVEVKNEFSVPVVVKEPVNVDGQVSVTNTSGNPLKVTSDADHPSYVRNYSDMPLFARNTDDYPIVARVVL